MNRTTDKRIIDKRVEINKAKLKELIFNIKEKNKITWEKLAEKLEVCEITLRNDWINKGNTIPLSSFKKLLNMSNQNIEEFKIKIKDPFWGQKLNKKKKKVIFPNIKTKEFAEFYGIMLGDGCIFSNNKGFAISGDKILDENYFKEYIKNSIHNLFGVSPALYISKKYRSMNCVLYSKSISEYLIKLGFPKGLKSSGKLEIPKFILNDKKLSSHCLRGIMDTDGSLSAHPNSKIMIHLSITNGGLRNCVQKGLKKLGIKGGVFNKGIMIYGKDKIKKFHNEIGFSNYKNILKYQKFMETGKVPSSKEIERFLTTKTT